MTLAQEISTTKQNKALTVSTVSFTACFAVWTIFSIVGIQLQEQLGLTETEFGLLLGTPILTGSLSRIFLGIWSDLYGGRVVFVGVMISASIATFLLSFVDNYLMALLAALGVGLAGGSFAVGIAYVSKWYPQVKQGTALGIFGVGNIGAAVTSFSAPFVLVAFGWEMVAQIWAGVLAATALLFWLTTEDDPELVARKQREVKTQRSMLRVIEPLRDLQVWRFAIYYFFVFGAFVALALWLPRYLVDVYSLDIKTAGILAALYIIPASLFRAYGGHLSDKYGARTIMYLTFGVSIVCTFMLSYPHTDYVIYGIEGPISFSTSMGLVPFVLIIFVLGFFMSLGKAAVFKHIPVYYPKSVGVVGGLVGMVGGLGGFFLPIAFGVMNDLTGIWTSCFMLLFLLASISMLWMHLSIISMERKANVQIRDLPELPEMESIHIPSEHGAALGHKLYTWQPNDTKFWESTGKRIARQNLWISIPCLLLAFAVWLVWSVVVAKLPLVGFEYDTNQLFWLAALPGLSGATLRIFYSFMVPIMGGRLWSTLTTASLLIPAIGIGYAVQDPGTPYIVLLILALLCGLGGGNFASSMANISFFYPKSKKGHALALNAGLGNAGVSIMQFLVPIVITVGVFSSIGGEAQTMSDGGQMWLQNAGFIWVPFLLVATIAAWWGMHDIVSAEASFSEQSIILSRKQNWIMCILYTGTFGSFIGYSAGFPLLSQLQFPEVDALRFAFLGPLVGALSRAGTGWISDKYGGGRVTFLTFIAMIAAVLGVIYFLSIKDQPGAFWGFFAMFMILFLATGVGNASTFQMIPVIMRLEMPKLMPHLNSEEQVRQVDREAAAIIGFTSAIAAYGAFFIPKSYGTSIALTGSPMAALWCFLLFYVLCAMVTRHYYTRPGGLLHDTENNIGSSTTPQFDSIGSSGSATN
jgi:NNP family nitrate/nitrite transporter-like MFS transporter